VDLPVYQNTVNDTMQVNYSPRRTEGIGKCEGEAMERMWSYLRRFSCMTKEMTASHRNDLLTDGCLYYARRNLETMG